MWPLVVVVGWSWVVSKADSTVEHHVDDQQAFLAMADLNLTSLEGQGCKPCSDRQKGYCRSNDLIMDHCICDHRHIERLPYVEHTCYVPDRLQPTFATDCLEYVRVLECCCHAILLPLMKKKVQNRANNNDHISWLLAPLMFTILRL